MNVQYELFTTPAGKRALKQLPREVKSHLLKHLEPLKSNPHLGQPLEGQYRFLRSLHTQFAGTQYRVVYEIDERERAVVVY